MGSHDGYWGMVSRGRRMVRVNAFVCLIMMLVCASTAMAQSPLVIHATVGVRTFVTNLPLPPGVVRTAAVMELTRNNSWIDAPAQWDWENVLDSSGFVRSVNVYVTLDLKNTTQANGQTVCCWTLAETSMVATDVNGVQYAYPVQVYAQSW